MKGGAMPTYHISEARFGYDYRADGYQDAITKWVKATFCEGCIANEPDNFGNFIVTSPKGMIIRARISKVSE